MDFKFWSFEAWVCREENQTKVIPSHEIKINQDLLAHIYKKEKQFYFCPSFLAFEKPPDSLAPRPYIGMNNCGVWKVVKFLGDVL